MKKLFAEFRDFIMRGNVIDLAIGIVVGGAFSAVVKSVVDNIIMPPIGLLVGNVNFTDLFVILKQSDPPLAPQSTLEAAQTAGAVTLNYGRFINDVISFLIIALVIFLIIKMINNFHKQLKDRADKVIKSRKKDKTEEVVAETPTDKACPFCFQIIPFKATRCPFCTSQLIEEKLEQ